MRSHALGHCRLVGSAQHGLDQVASWSPFQWLQTRGGLVSALMVWYGSFLSYEHAHG